MNKQGFTLIEMAVVIIIIGLLVGGIFVGQSMIRSSHLHGVLSDAAKYNDAFNAFGDKYMSLPGDMPNAESYWGTPAGGCLTGNGTDKEVCNGNGDGNVYVANDFPNIAEIRSQWVMMANAGLIQGQYRFLAPNGGGTFVGVNVPRTAVGDASFMFVYGTNTILGDGLYSTVMPYRVHWLLFGNITSNIGVNRPVVTGKEGFTLDSKLDDGKPGTGIVRASRNGTFGGVTPNCQTTNDPYTAEYSMTTENPVCFLMFQVLE